MKIRVLGCSGNVSYGNDTTSFLVNDRVLIDAGTGAMKLSIDELRNISDIFITHSHLDHVVTLPFLADLLYDNIDHQIKIHCLQQTSFQLRKHVFNNSIWPDFFSIRRQDKSPVFVFSDIVANREYRIYDMTIEAAMVSHTVPALGFRINDRTGSIAFTGDTTTNDDFWNLINNRQHLDLLIAECAFPNEMKTLADSAGHYHPQSFSVDLEKCHHRAVTFISHMKTGYEDTIMKEIHRLTGRSDIAPLIEGTLHTQDL